MDKIQSFLLITLMFLGLLIWQAWQNDYPERPKISTDSSQIEIITSPTDQVAQEKDVPELIPPTSAHKAIQPPFETDHADDNNQVVAETDTLKLAIGKKGASLNSVLLKEYPITLDEPEPLLFLGTRGQKQFLYQGGLFGESELPTHHSNFEAPSSFYHLQGGENELSVPFRWQGKGLDITKTFRLTRGSYLIDVEYRIRNQSVGAVKVHHYEQFKRTKESSYNGLVYTFTGAIFSTPESRFRKFDFDDLEERPIDQTALDSWIGNMQHYFVAALIPPRNSSARYYSKILDPMTYTVGYVSPGTTVEPGASITLTGQIFAGPKKQDILKEIAPGLDLSVDYGMLWFLAKPLFITLRSIYSVTNNWGFAIVLLTILIKLIFYPLSAAGYKSMAKLRKVHPKMIALKERFSDDKAQLNQAMMKLYKEEKINPLGGCFPILIQIPVFIALYWVLLETVEIRQAPFIFWITDLSSKDPFFVLPLLMGISMWFQQKLNPAPVDPVQAKVMQFLPIIFTGFFAFFPSGLVLYWVANNVLSIIQQWRITSQLEDK